MSHYAIFEGFEINMTHAQALGASQPGRDATADVAALVAEPSIAKQLDTIGPDLIRAELRGYGAWDAGELADDGANRARIVWCAACDIRDGANRPDRYHVDGTDAHGCYAGNATAPPFMVHDCERREPAAGPFDTLTDAQTMRDRLETASEYERRVIQLEFIEGLTTSDAQGAADAEGLQP